MFKKFKDKLAEEMKQSPSRLQAGMQQLAQAVISPAASNNLIGDIGTSIEDLNLTSEEAETLRDSSATGRFQSVDLQAPNSMERSRRSSFSSVTSDNFFPTYESPGSLYHIQSDMEQSASEFEDNSSSQLDHVSKEDLYASYKKLRTKYTKYRAVYRELYKENTKMKSVLVETQDKALRRIANLKEQCQLEQEAKAHLEEALRNDIEEKDHLINTLTTKIELLRSNGSSDGPSLGQGEGGGGVVDLLTGPEDNLVSENAALREKVKRFETLLAKCNESLKRNKEKISQLTENRDILERDLNVLKASNEERTEMLESEVYKAKREILSLGEQIEVFKKREEDSALSLAENKLFIHRELELKEEQNKQLQQELRKLAEYKDILAEAVVKYDREFKQFEILITDQRNATDLDKKFSQLQEILASKSEAMKLIQQDVKRKFIGTEDETRSDRESARRKRETSPPTAANESVAKSEEQIDRSRDELEIQNAQLLGLRTELKSSKSTINDLKEMLREVTMDWEQVKREKECLIANILEYKRILGILRRDCGVLKSEIKENFSEQGETLRKEIAALTTKAFAALSQRKKEEKPKEQEEEEEETRRNVEASGVELKTIINENNALRKRCEELSEQNEGMLSKANEFDDVKTRNVKLIAEVDELNFKLRDVSELQETQDKLQSEMEGLRGRFPLDKNLPASNNEHLSNEVSSLKEKLGQYDVVSRENAVLKQELIELKNELSSALNNAEAARSEQSRNAELGLENFAKKCSEYETAIVDLTGKFTEQTCQLEKLHEELAKQKKSFSELSDKYEVRNSEFKEANDAFVKQTSELEELNERYDNRCTEIEDLRTRETEILKQLDETVRVRQEMLAKVGELEASRNGILEAGNVEMETLKSRHDEATRELESLTKINAQLVEEIASLKSHGEARSLRIEELEVSNVDISRNNKELKEERNNLSKLNAELHKSLKDFKEENERLEESLAALRENLESLKEKLDSETELFSEGKQELAKLRTELHDFEKRNAELGEKLAVLESQESRQSELRSEVENCNSLLLARVGELETKLAELEAVRNANEELEKQLESTRSKCQELENADTASAELVEEIGELKSKLKDREAENQELRNRIGDLESNVSDLEIQKSENVELSSRIRELEKAESDNVALSKEMGESKSKVNDLQVENQDLKSRIEDLKNTVSDLEIKNAEAVDLRRELTVSEDAKLAITKELEELEKRNVDLVSQFEGLRTSFDQTEAELRLQQSRSSDLLLELESEKSDRSRSVQEKSKAIEELEKAAGDSAKKFSDELEALKIANEESQEQLTQRSLKISELEEAARDSTEKIAEHRREVEALVAEKEVLNDRLAEANAEHSKALEDKSKVVTELEKAAKDFENRSIGLREEIETLEGANKNLREDLMRVAESKNIDEDLRKENRELSAKLDEALMVRDSKGSQLDVLNEELKQRTQELSEKLKTNEEEQSMRIKQLVKEFQAQIHDKDEQIQAALEKRFERQQNYESELIQQYKEQLKDFQIELTAKSEQIERLILDNKETIQAYKDQIQELTETITRIKKEHVSEVQSVEHNWKSILKERTDRMENKHVDEVNELTKEWWNERKDAINSDASPAGELESTSRVAMATIQSNTGSLHSLQQTLISQKRELSELRKLLRIRNDGLEGSTEIEYLRNILFEYMMGRETLVLSKVISAVVKFDQEQTTKVLKKEEDKLTLLGSLGLL